MLFYFYQLYQENIKIDTNTSPLAESYKTCKCENQMQGDDVENRFSGCECRLPCNIYTGFMENLSTVFLPTVEGINITNLLRIAK